MVRVSPVYRSLAQGGRWYTHSDGFQTTVAVDVADQFNADSDLPTDQYFITCHRTHQSHPFGVFYGENPLNYAFTLLLLEITLLIVLTRIIRFLLKPLKQPRIVSEILVSSFFFFFFFFFFQFNFIWYVSILLIKLKV
jgi:hypothetical protein